MARVDHSIYLQQQTPDIMGSIQKGLNMRNMIQQQKLQDQAISEQQALKDAYKAGIVEGPDGQYSMDQAKTLSALAKVSPAKFIETQQAFATQDREKQKASREDFLSKLDITQKAFNSITDPSSYNAVKENLIKLGIADPKDLPPIYDPKWVEQRKQGLLTTQERFNQEMKRREVGLKERELGIKQKEKQDSIETYVPGVGYALTKQDAKDVKAATEMKSKFDRQIQELIDLRGKYGGEFFDREAVGRGKQLSKDILLTYKNLAKLGVLSKSDEDIINAIIPADPLEFTFMPGQDPIMHQLTKFKGDLDADYKTTLATRMKKLEGPKLSPEDQQAITWAKQNPKDPRSAAILKSNGIGG